MPRSSKVTAAQIVPSIVPRDEVQAPTVPVSEGGSLFKSKRVARAPRVPSEIDGNATAGDLRCMHCKMRTTTLGAGLHTTDKGRTMEKGTCGICNGKKARLTKSNV